MSNIIRDAMIAAIKRHRLEGRAVRAEAEDICSSRRGINKNNIPDNPEFDVNETRVATMILKSSTSTVSQEIRGAIFDLHKHFGRTSHELARIFSLEVNLVELIIQGDGHES